MLYPSGPPVYEERAIGGGRIRGCPSTDDGFSFWTCPEGCARSCSPAPAPDAPTPGEPTLAVRRSDVALPPWKPSS